MRVLVLGGTRFIGRAVVDALLSDHEVSVLNRGTRPLWDARITQVRADRADPAAMRAALTAPQLLFLTAADAAHIRGADAGASS